MIKAIDTEVGISSVLKQNFTLSKCAGQGDKLVRVLYTLDPSTIYPDLLCLMGVLPHSLFAG